MQKRLNELCAIAALFTVLSVSLFITPAMAHHSFAMYDQTKTVTLTGVLTRFVAQANHAEIHFVPLGPNGKPLRGNDGKPITWGVEMAGAARHQNSAPLIDAARPKSDSRRLGTRLEAWWKRQGSR